MTPAVAAGGGGGGGEGEGTPHAGTETSFARFSDRDGAPPVTIPSQEHGAILMNQ
jgi:hypothetical protein